MSNPILDELIAKGVSSDTILAVARLIADAEITNDRRARNRDRMSSVRTRAHTNEHVRTNENTRKHTETPPPAYTTPPKEIKPKKVLSAKHALPTDFELSESDKQHAFDRGWTPDKLQSELARFVDHARANNRKQADWHAAWRNWVTSPFQAPKANGASPNGSPSKPSVSDVLARICDETSPDFDGLFPQIGRG
jgi:hypothetical protein